MVLGEAKVYEDGSALFTVPARKPVYFQALDERGRAVQTMRSWSTLQPGEYAACVGCHENKSTAPPARDYGFSLAMKAGPQALEPFYGPPRGFSFPHEIQPILKRHCIRCHKNRQPIEALAQGKVRQPLLARPVVRQASRLPLQPSQYRGRDALPLGETPAPLTTNDETAFSLLGDVTVDNTAKRKWSDAYLMLTQATATNLASPSKATAKAEWLAGLARNQCPSRCRPTLPAQPGVSCCPSWRRATRE
jgi:hypothetical protein